MKTILIDVDTKELREIEVSGLEEIYKAIGCRLVDKRSIDNLDIIVDDEGIYNSGKIFLYGETDMLFGKGLIVGANDGGSWTDCPITLEEAKSKVKFLSTQEAYQVAKELDL